jgi:hypothetical protein
MGGKMTVFLKNTGSSQPHQYSNMPESLLSQTEQIPVRVDSLWTRLVGHICGNSENIPPRPCCGEKSQYQSLRRDFEPFWSQM